VSKSFRDYKPSYGDVHLYPANYGTSAKFIESISINCLEMASVGIPSFITRGGLLTWPEFLGNPCLLKLIGLILLELHARLTIYIKLR
jgi:hypothetical protein